MGLLNVENLLIFLSHINIFSLLAITGCLYTIIQVKRDFIMQRVVKKTLYYAAFTIIAMAIIENSTYVLYGYRATETGVLIGYTLIYLLMGVFPYIFLILLDKKIFYENKMITMGVITAMYMTTLLLNIEFPILFVIEPTIGFNAEQFCWIRPLLLTFLYSIAFGDVFKSMYKISRSEISTVNYTMGLFVIGIVFYDIWYSGEIISMLLSLGLTYVVSIFHRLELKTDSVTSLPNRYVYINDAKSYENKNDIVVCSIDLNDLKKVNDSLGHDEGDAYIRANALTISDFLSPYGTLYRTGGDEFIFLGKNLRAVNSLLSRLQNKCYCSCKYGNYNLAFSYGVTIKGKCQSIYEAEKKADSLMYVNKRRIKGENNVR